MGRKVRKEETTKETHRHELNNEEDIILNRKNFFVKRLLNKNNITFFVLGLLDIVLIIYSARKNIVNYVNIDDQSIFVSKTKYLLLGRNYITVVITIFFYGYTCLINRFFLQRRNTKKFLLWLFFILVIVNLGLFLIFTKRVY